MLVSATRWVELPARRKVAVVVFAVCLLLFVVVEGIGWNHTLLDRSGFRQTQTAITARYMVGKAPALAYETPVLGPPWSIPFEFPIYQWLVAYSAGLLGTPLEPTGRFVSAAFFLASLFPAWRVLAFFGFSPEHRLLALSLFLTSPFYLFWSRSASEDQQFNLLIVRTKLSCFTY